MVKLINQTPALTLKYNNKKHTNTHIAPIEISKNEQVMKRRVTGRGTGEVGSQQVDSFHLATVLVVY